MSSWFYKDLPGFTAFAEACSPGRYAPAPEDWLIVLADVEDSTGAIKSGRYKDVNMVGAACITAVVNACKEVSIPFVFGGDGATLLIPPECVEPVKKELFSLRQRARHCHGLSLRVGIVPVQEVVQRGKRFDVGKLSMPTGCQMAMFYGGGAALADALVKQGQFALEADDEPSPPNLAGLSCRWQPVAARNGVILTLLIQACANQSEDDLYREINSFMEGVLGAEANPVHWETMTYAWPTLEALRQNQMTWREGNVLANLCDQIFWILLFNMLNRFNIKLEGFDVTRYRQDMVTNSDYQKFDDMLRMVVDCSQEQAAVITQYLEKLHAENRILYGMHFSKTALMTCFVQSGTEPDGHVHFVDGDNGGYTLAAVQLKQQLAKQQQALEASAG